MKLGFLAIVLLLGLILFGNKEVGASACKKVGGAKVIVKTKILRTKYNYSKSIAQLSGLKSDTISPYGRGMMVETHGITQGTLKISASFEAERKNLTGNRTCIAIKKVNMMILYDPVVFIAKDHQRGGCLFNAVTDHEDMHVKLSIGKIKDYRSKVYRVMRKFDNSNHYSKVVSAQLLKYEQRKVEGRYQKFITALTNSLNKQLRAVNATIDTKSEYDRVHSKCR